MRHDPRNKEMMEKIAALREPSGPIRLNRNFRRVFNAHVKKSTHSPTAKEIENEKGPDDESTHPKRA